MSEEWYSRTRLLLGASSIDRLSGAKVAIFGVGGVGGYVLEALARCGVGSFVVVDPDYVCESNLNRQILATTQTLGRLKTDAAEERVLSINPGARVEKRPSFFLPEIAGEFDFKEYDYVVDAVDTVAAKIQIVLSAKEAGIPVISAMGAGNKLDPTGFEVADLFETEMDPLARVMRRELRKRGVTRLKVVYSKEKPLEIPMEEEPSSASGRKRRSTPGSVSFVPSVAGLIIASEVVKDLTSV